MFFFGYRSQRPIVETESYSADTAGDEEARASSKDQSDNFYSIMENDNSIIACVPSEGAKTQKGGPHANPVATYSKAAEVKCTKFDQLFTKMNKYTSPQSCVATCDIMVGNEPSVCMSAFSQTEDPAATDKNIVTEVHMADLDYLAEVRLKPESHHNSVFGETQSVKRFRNL